jgi:hypothetical protein
VVAFGPLSPKEPFFKNGILPVPQSHAQTQPLLLVRDAGYAILTPAIGVGAGHVVVQEVQALPLGE